MSEKLLPIPYDELRESVEEIRSNPDTATFLGQGAESSVWKFEFDNSPLVAKFMNKMSSRGRPRNIAKAAENKVDSGLRGLGIPGLEQIQSASPQDGIVVYDFVEGTMLSKIDTPAAESIPRRDIEVFEQMIVRATEQGLEFDGGNYYGSNAFYDPKTGFTVIDYQASASLSYERNRTRAFRSLGATVLQAIAVFYPDVPSMDLTTIFNFELLNERS